MLRLIQVVALVGSLLGVNSPDVVLGGPRSTGVPIPNRISFSYDRSPRPSDLFNAKAQRFSIHPTKRDATSHAIFEKEGQTTCEKSPDLTFDREPIERYFVNHGILIDSEKIRQTQLFIVTQPHVVPDGKFATYYVVAVSLEECHTDGVKKICNLRASAIQKTAPVAGHRVKASEATDGNDDATTSLIDLATKSVHDATFWCTAKSSIKKIIKPLNY
jgi:hypothetical protein